MAANCRELPPCPLGSDHRSLAPSKQAFRFRYSTKGVSKRFETSSSFCRELDVSGVIEPGSPRVGCMGQIKKEKASRGTTKFQKLKKMFSSKRLTKGGSERFDGDYDVVGIIRFDRPLPLSVPPPIDLDPPLPVAKTGVVRDENSTSLWKRRCGAQLEGLNLHQQREGCPSTIKCLLQRERQQHMQKN